MIRTLALAFGLLVSVSTPALAERVPNITARIQAERHGPRVDAAELACSKEHRKDPDCVQAKVVAAHVGELFAVLKAGGLLQPAPAYTPTRVESRNPPASRGRSAEAGGVRPRFVVAGKGNNPFVKQLTAPETKN